MVSTSQPYVRDPVKAFTTLEMPSKVSIALKTLHTVMSLKNLKHVGTCDVGTYCSIPVSVSVVNNTITSELMPRLSSDKSKHFQSSTVKTDSPRKHVESYHMVTKPSSPFSMSFLHHVYKFAAQVTSLLQPSPDAETSMALFPAEEEHIILFDESTSLTPIAASSALNVAPRVTGTPSHLLMKNK